MNAASIPKNTYYQALTRQRLNTARDYKSLAPAKVKTSSSVIKNKVRAKIVSSNKIHLPILPSLLYLTLIIFCSIIPSLYSFGYMVVFCEWIISFYPIVIAIVTEPITNFILLAIIAGVFGNRFDALFVSTFIKVKTSFL